MKKNRVNRQEKFARDNFAGVEDNIEQIIKIIDRMKELVSADKAQKDSIAKELQELASMLSVPTVVVTIKLTNVVGHALNAKSTTLISELLHFMDKYSIGDTVINDSIMKIVSTRQFSGSLLTMAAILAAQNDDLEFLKYIEYFAEKNKNRDNIYNVYYVPYDTKQLGEFYNMDRISNIEQVQLEALIHGSKDVYDYLTKGKGIRKDFIMNYISSKYDFNYTKKLTKEEVQNVISLEPTLLEEILEYMPENISNDLKNLFIF